MEKRTLALEVAKGFLNLPYRWGGNDPLEGFDCSGLIVEVLQSVGVLDPSRDLNAHGLSNLFVESEITEPGNLVFWDWDNDGLIDHVEMIAFMSEDGEPFTIGASGGGSSTTSVQSATSQNAYVKIRPMRAGVVKIVDPFKR